MKIRKYIGDSVQEAMTKLKEDLGPDAVVLNSKTIKPTGIFSFFKKPRFEITAAYEENKINNDIKSIDKESKDLQEIKGELNELKNIMRDLSLSTEKEANELPTEIRIYHRIMVENGVDYNIAYSILNEIFKEDTLEDKNKDDIDNIIKNKLKTIIGKSEPLTVGDEQEVVFFIGPTGVGKTTSLAKIAASLVLEDKFEVGLITSDTYRVGAVDQLKIYSDILNLPLSIAYTTEDLENSFLEMKDKDIILVDTAGRNHNDIEQTEDLKNILRTRSRKQIYLLLSATSDIKVLERLVHRYSFLEDYKLVITKVDESNNYGNILNARYIFDKDIVYYTVGQNVPEDIRTLDVDKLADRLVKER